MRRWSAICVLTSLAFAAALAPMSAGDFKLEKGFTLLFNGKNLDGWRERNSKDNLDGKTEAFKGRFKVTDGVLVYDPAVGGDKYIETVKSFEKDVHFKFDFKAGAKCNNDVLFRGTKFDIILPADEKKANKENKHVKLGEWATFELVAKDGTIEHKINGETVRTTKSPLKASTLVLRAEFGAIEVKNIRVKE